MARFVMNVLLVSGGYPWIVIRDPAPAEDLFRTARAQNGESMKKRILSATLSAAMLAFPASQSAAAEYRIDPAHSVVQFKISHLGYS